MVPHTRRLPSLKGGVWAVVLRWPKGTPIRRVALISMHTSPLDQPGAGDAGGLNVYVVELARRLTALGIEVDIFTRATSGELPQTVELVPGATVRHVTAGPYEGLEKADLPAQLCAFARGVLRAEAMHEPGHYDVVHSHYWLSGQVGWLAKDRWGVPLVHTMHTMAKVKNGLLAAGDTPEPDARVIGERQVVDAADRLVAHTDEEARQLTELYDADPDRVKTVPPGVDLGVFRPGSTTEARHRLGLAQDAAVLLFVGRIQPLKAPDVLVRAVAHLVDRNPRLRSRLTVAIVGAPSGTGLAEPEHLQRLAAHLGVADLVRFESPGPQDQLVDWYRAATATVMPSYSESFGLAALESQASGTPVVASSVGGLGTAVAHEQSGMLVDGHDPVDFADALRRLIEQPRLHDRLSTGAAMYASGFGWPATVASLVDTYRGAIADMSAPLALAAGG